MERKRVSQKRNHSFTNSYLKFIIYEFRLRIALPYQNDSVINKSKLTRIVFSAIFLNYLPITCKIWKGINSTTFMVWKFFRVLHNHRTNMKSILRLADGNSISGGGQSDGGVRRVAPARLAATLGRPERRTVARRRHRTRPDGRRKRHRLAGPARRRRRPGVSQSARASAAPPGARQVRAGSASAAADHRRPPIAGFARTGSSVSAGGRGGTDVSGVLSLIRSWWWWC